MPSADPDWTAYVSAFGTPIIAALVGAIAYRQWRTAQDRLKLDLFDRRFEIYLSCMKFLSSILTSGHVEDNKLFEFTAATRNAKWLFSNDVANYLDRELRARALRHQTTEYELRDVPVGEQRTAIVKRQSELFDWLMGQYDVIDTKFSPYLKLRH